MPISAFVLIDVTGNHTKSAYKTLQRIQGVKALYAVTGPHDLIAHVEADTIEELNDLILTRIRNVDGVVKTSTAIILNITPSAAAGQTASSQESSKPPGSTV